jgi:hypothetical protein
MPCSLCKQDGHNKTTCPQTFLQKQKQNQIIVKYRIFEEQNKILKQQLIDVYECLDLYKSKHSDEIKNITKKNMSLRSDIHDVLFDNSDSIPEHLYVTLMNLLKI